jgi:hypothetical protein
VAIGRQFGIVALIVLVAGFGGGCEHEDDFDPHVGSKFAGTGTSTSPFRDGAMCTTPSVAATLAIGNDGKVTFRMDDVPTVGYGNPDGDYSKDSTCFVMTDVPRHAVIGRGVRMDPGLAIPVTGCETAKLTEARGQITLSDVGRLKVTAEQTATVTYDCMDPLHPAETMYSVSASLTEVKP